MARLFGDKRKLISQWGEQYGASYHHLRNLSREDFEQFCRMEDHARATIFSSIRWDKAHPGWKATKKYPRQIRKRPQSDAYIERMLMLASKRRAA